MTSVHAVLSEKQTMLSQHMHKYLVVMLDVLTTEAKE